MNETVQGESPAAATTAEPIESVDTETTVEPGAESAPAKVEPIDPEFASEIESVQKKFNKLTETRRSEERARRRAEEDRDYWRSQALQQAQAKPPETPAPVIEAKAKTLADFAYDEGQYQTYLLDLAEQRATTAAERRIRESQERDTAQRRQADFAAREREFAKTQTDYYEVTRTPGLNITQAMVDAASDSEESAAVLYHLAKNPEVADRIARLPALAAARELGRVEARLLAEREKASAPKVSKAPPPTPKIEGTGDPAVEKNPTTMSDSEYAKWRRRQIAQRR